MELQVVLTPGDVAEKLRLDPGLVITLFEKGHLSGFRHGDSWRIHMKALIADLERLHRQLKPAAPIQLGPRSNTSFRIPPELMPAPTRRQEKSAFPECFAIHIEIDNDSDYAGEFALYLGTENMDGPWTIRQALDCTDDDSEILVRGKIEPGAVSRFFDAELQGHLGDRLFLAVPEQRGLDEAFEKVFVLEDHLALRLIIHNRGLLSRKRAIRVKHLPRRDLPLTGTD
jgi:hypothetical protein